MIPQCSPVNLIHGVSGSGKTSLLEAIFLHSGAQNPELSFRVSSFRGLDVTKIELGRSASSPWETLFRSFDVTLPIELGGQIVQLGRRQVSLRVLRGSSDFSKLADVLGFSAEGVSADAAHVLEVECAEGDAMERRARNFMIIDARGARVVPSPSVPQFPAIFLSAKLRSQPIEDAHRLGKMELTKNSELLHQAMRYFVPSLKKIVAITSDNQPHIFCDIGLPRLVPLPCLGDAAQRMCQTVLAMFEAQGGVLLIDEVENGVSELELPGFLHTLAQLAMAFRVQMFATTNLRAQTAPTTVFHRLGVTVTQVDLSASSASSNLM